MMSSAAEIKKKLEQNWIGFLRVNSHKLLGDTLVGSSPPSLFVGHYGYPNVRVGPMISPSDQGTTILEKTDLWAGKSLEEIVNYRLSLVLGTMNTNVQDISGRYIETIQELAMSEGPAKSEAIFEKRPLSDVYQGEELRLDSGVTPFGPAGSLRAFKASSMSADQHIEEVYYDTDMRAADAIMKLYKHGLETTIIQRVLSMGMLGVRKNRKLVPTRWSIAATDDIVSGMLVKANETNPTIDLFEVTRYSHLANYYTVILIPDNVWSFEMMECWFTNSGQMAAAIDYEDATALNHNPTTEGAYYATRLGVAEHLARRHKKAAAIVIREIRPEYVMPIGVWQIREGVRQALKGQPRKFECLDRAMSYACSSISVSKNEVTEKSRIWKLFTSQRKITDFA